MTMTSSRAAASTDASGWASPRSHQVDRDVALQTRQADVETGAQEVGVARLIEVDLRVDREIWRKSDFHFARRARHCALEAGRPAGGEQLLRVRADARRARNRKFDV